MKKSVLPLTLATLLGSSPLFAADAATDQRIAELEQRIDALAAMSDGRTGEASSVHIGGYGELHLNQLSNKTAGGSDKNEMDYHRFVLFFGHDFDATTRFHSELELEHSIAGESKAGEIELEQAYVEFDVAPAMQVKGGMFLIPVGIINETHEPPTFYGVERNPVEKNIIPATWWEGGAMLSGHSASGLSYDLAIHSGLANNSYSIRSGRQKLGKAAAETFAYTGRLKYTGMAGLELAATLNYQSDLTQGSGTKAVDATLLETHAVYSSGPFALRALYASWTLTDDGSAAGKDEQQGWYLEPSFKVSDKFGVFARYNSWDNAAGDSTDSVYTQVDLGVNYWPHADVVVKLDYQDQDVPSGAGEYDGINLGIGYQF